MQESRYPKTPGLLGKIVAGIIIAGIALIPLLAGIALVRWLWTLAFG